MVIAAVLIKYHLGGSLSVKKSQQLPISDTWYLDEALNKIWKMNNIT